MILVPELQPGVGRETDTMDVTDEQDVDRLLHRAGAEPDMATLRREYEDAGGADGSRWSTDRAEQARFMRWAGQSRDGRKHREDLRKEPLPWENASDTRVPLVDGIIRDLKTALVMAFTRAQLRVEPKRAGDAAKANTVQRLMEHFRRTKRREWRREAELAADYQLHDGVAAWSIGWEEQVATERNEIALAQLAEFEDGARLQAIILDPELEDTAVGIAQELLQVSRKAARQLVRDLRNQGKAEFPRPYVAYSGPCFTARKFAQDIFWPASATDLDRARVVFVRDFLTETELRENVLTDDWEEEAVERGLEHRGSITAWDLEDDPIFRDGSSEHSRLADSREDLVEVVWAYYPAMNEEGLPERFCTVFCPAVGGAANAGEEDGQYFKHGPVGYAHGKSGHVPIQLECLSRRLVASRGVPEISATWQDEVKAQADMLNDRASLEINPTVMVPARLGEKYRIGPGVKVITKGQGGLEYLDPPKGNPQLAFSVIDMVERRAADYWGTPHEQILAAKWQARLQTVVDAFLASAEEAFTQMHQLAVQYLSAEELRGIFGGEAYEKPSAEAIAGEYDFHLVFDARDMDIEFTYKKLDALMKLAVPLDRAGTIDFAKLTAHVVGSIDSSLADVLLGDPEGAAMRVRDEVDKDVRGMALGNEPRYVELDPAAGMKLRFLQDIVGRNPKYQQALFGEQRDEVFAGLIENYQRNLEQSVAQLGENIEAGRTGVKRLS